MVATIEDEDWRRLTTSHPGVSLEREVFATFMAERESTYLEELFLACAASRGDEEAIDRLETQYIGQLRASMSRAHTEESDFDDLMQSLRLRLFSAPAGGIGKIGEYSGRGPLGAWLRIVASRHVTSARRKRTESPTTDSLDLEDEASRTDPELAYLRSAVRPLFQAALSGAVASLEAEQRNVLRYYYLDDLTIEQIGSIYGLHKTSALRRIRRARALLVERTRAELKRSALATSSELASILRAVESEIELSIKELLVSSEDP